MASTTRGSPFHESLVQVFGAGHSVARTGHEAVDRLDFAGGGLFQLEQRETAAQGFAELADGMDLIGDPPLRIQQP